MVGGGGRAPGTEMRMSQADEEGESAWMEGGARSVKCRKSVGKGRVWLSEVEGLCGSCTL